MSDVPWGVLLSGGLDSSLVASIASRILYKRKQQSKSMYHPQMHSFSIGLEGSPDLAAARKVADYLQTVHHEMTFTVQDGLDAVRDVIYHLETYDVTTVRAATPMFLMSRKIKACGIKMVLSGEGADEVMAGYLYVVFFVRILNHIPLILRVSLTRITTYSRIPLYSFSSNVTEILNSRFALENNSRTHTQVLSQGSEQRGAFS